MQLSQQLTSIQSRKADDDRDARQLAEQLARQPADSSSAQLLDVIKFLRREKEIAETRLEAVDAERARLQQQSDALTSQLETSRASLQQERERSAVSVATAAEHADLLRKVERLNILQESNRMLREEKSALTRQTSELEARLAQAQADVAPLQASARALEAERDALTADCRAANTEIDRCVCAHVCCRFHRCSCFMRVAYSLSPSSPWY